ncbi:MAG: methionine--tRNA ligase [Dehalococcoidia bacterium]|nr:MAG: methionine--tRNA ligase [Dehalococcoidia bacterium]
MSPNTSVSPPNASGQAILVAVGWPYANNHLHAGHLAGAYLPADIFARYQRMRGNRVLMVSGSDSHGTPVTVRAEQEGTTPEDVFQRYHQSFLDTFKGFGISFDLFTSTDTANHIEVTQQLFLQMLEQGDLYEADQELLFDSIAGRFLPDRYVEGICPKCSFDGARGDQCDNCGSTLDALDLINPRSKLSDATPERRKSRHFFLRLTAFTERLMKWIEQPEHRDWRPHVRNFTLGMLREGLIDRSITRDITWGVPIPLEGYESKRIYVWFEAVIGYLSATKEWAATSGNPDGWKAWWTDPAARTVYFIGKDNVPFHTVIWPAMLMSAGGLNLPSDVPANQYVTMSGSKASKSRGGVVWLPDYLERYDPDPFRYALTASMPETNDTDFTWADYVRRNNDELVARWGNLVNRVLTITRRNFDGRVPRAPSTLSPESQALLDRVDGAFDTVGGDYDRVQMRRALAGAIEVAGAANQYLDARAPWQAVKTDRDHAAETLYVAINAISGLITILNPVLPFTTQKAWEYLGHEGKVGIAGWRRTPVLAGTVLPEPGPLYRKLDDSVVAEEEARLGL